ncbi:MULTISPECIES: rcc01693 family protein [unclassified Shimia]|uniref:rcc01693 family protein n=1 Tax=unclassified Shimia TaxID=2630038 RepID=UPI003106B8D9
MATFDWPALMAAGLRGLGLSPAEFWALTPVELAVKLGNGDVRAAMTRAGFDALLQAYPDQEMETDDG